MNGSKHFIRAGIIFVATAFLLLPALFPGVEKSLYLLPPGLAQKLDVIAALFVFFAPIPVIWVIIELVQGSFAITRTAVAEQRGESPTSLINTPSNGAAWWIAYAFITVLAFLLFLGQSFCLYADSYCHTPMDVFVPWLKSTMNSSLILAAVIYGTVGILWIKMTISIRRHL